MDERPVVSVSDPIGPLLMTNRGAAFGLQGFVHHAVRRLRAVQLTLRQGDVRVPAQYQLLQTGVIDPRISSALEANGAAGLDGGFYVSAVFPHDPALCAGLAVVEAALTWEDGRVDELRLCFARVEIVLPIALPSNVDAEGLVGIVMATYNPEPELFRNQVESLREQIHRNWICVISDDASNPQWREHIQDTVRDEPRFVLLEGGMRLGFYRNFERALAALPPQCRFVALSDQDDVWKPDRLSVGLRALDDAKVDCIYSDMEIVQSDGRRLSPSFWVHRRSRYGSLAGLMLANVATGMTMLFRRDLLSASLPLPATPNLTYHDAWIALVAAARDALRYVPRPLVEYIQHGGNHTGAMTPPESSRLVLKRSARRFLDIVGIPFARSMDAARISRLLLEMGYWSGGEAVRMRILADAMRSRLPDAERNGSLTRLGEMCRRFGVATVLRSGIDWHDRYRRSVAVELAISSTAQRIVLAYVQWFRRRSRRRASRPVSP